MKWRRYEVVSQMAHIFQMIETHPFLRPYLVLLARLDESEYLENVSSWT